MAFEHYIQKGSQCLRMGYTTGTCAALASKAAAYMLLGGASLSSVDLMTPKGLPVTVDILDISFSPDRVSCAVMKDAGDDPDITDRILIYADVQKLNAPGIIIDGGKGVGRVTKPGLDQPVGTAAINRIPRQMIATELDDICNRFNYHGGLSVSISIPEGERLAKRTFNPKLGIVDGLSVLGTSGIVEPMSTQALIDCIGIELRSLAASGYRKVVLTPGNYGETFLSAQPFLKAAPTVKFSNYIGDALDFAAACNFDEILLVGHIGKLVKLAGGIMNTHSSVADCRVEILAAHAAMHGADLGTIKAIMDSVSTDACIDILDEVGLREQVITSLLEKIQSQISRRVGDSIKIGAIMYSNIYGQLGQTATAQALANSFTDIKT